MRFLLFPILLSALYLIPKPGWSGGAEEVAVVGVHALMKSPEQYSRQIKVSGVVSQVVEDEEIFGLIDLEEFKTCKKVTCASLVLPIRWEGSMPKIGQQLTVTGEIEKEGERYLFIASELALASPQ